MPPPTIPLDRYIVAFNRARRGYPPLPGGPTAQDFLTAFANNSDLAQAARDEVARLAARGKRILAEHDAESRARHDTLVNMLAAFDAQQEKAA